MSDVMLGHNNPPEPTPVEKIQKQYGDLFKRLEELEASGASVPRKIEDDATAEKVQDWLKQARFAMKTADEARKIEYEPFKKIVDHINAIFNRPKDAVKKLSDEIKEGLDEYLQRKAAREKAELEEKARKQREEMERAQREAEEAERRRVEAERRAQEERDRAARAQKEREEAEERARQEKARAEAAKAEQKRLEEQRRIDEARRAEEAALRAQREEADAERRAEEEAKARAEAEERDRLHREKMEQLRQEQERAEIARREERERATKLLEERRAAEEQEREASQEARSATKDEKTNMAMAERSERMASKSERAASDDAANSRTRSELGALGTLQKRWTVEITDERRLPKDILWDYIPIEAKKAAVWKWMVNQPNDEKFRKMDGALIERTTTAQVR